MGGVLLVIVVLLVVVYCIVEVAQAKPDRVRLMPRWLWAVAIVLLPGIGAIGWLLLGRPSNDAIREPPPAPRAPDDDPDFLRKLRGQ